MLAASIKAKDAPVHQGVVRKRGAFHKALKSRYFVVRHQTVSYYKTRLDFEAREPPQGSMPCRGLVVASQMKMDGKDGFFFALTATHIQRARKSYRTGLLAAAGPAARTITCCVPTPLERAKWIEVLQSEAKLASGTPSEHKDDGNAPITAADVQSASWFTRLRRQPSSKVTKAAPLPSPSSPADLSAPAESSAALIKPRKVGYYAQQQKGKGGPVKAPRARALTVEEVMLQQEAAIMLQGAVRRAATEFAFFVAKKRYQAAAARAHERAVVRAKAAAQAAGLARQRALEVKADTRRELARVRESVRAEEAERVREREIELLLLRATERRGRCVCVCVCV